MRPQLRKKRYITRVTNNVTREAYSNNATLFVTFVLYNLRTILLVYCSIVIFQFFRHTWPIL